MTHTLCALHIRKAANHHISNKTNVHDRKAIQDACLKFHSGIFYQQRSAPFEEKVQNLKDSDMFKSQPKDFRDALERNIAQFRTKVVIPGEEVEKRQQYRTTNAVESQNFVMKSALDWKVTLLTDLVHNYFQKRYKVQDRFLERAIFGIGDYALTPGLEKLGLDKATWIAMDGKARERHFAKMFTALRRKHEKEAAAKGPRDLQADIPLSCEKEGDYLPCDEDDEVKPGAGPGRPLVGGVPQSGDHRAHPEHGGTVVDRDTGPHSHRHRRSGPKRLPGRVRPWRWLRPPLLR